MDDERLEYIIKNLEVQTLAVHAIFNVMLDEQSPDSVQVQKMLHSIANIEKAIYTLKTVNPKP